MRPRVDAEEASSVRRSSEPAARPRERCAGCRAPGPQKAALFPIRGRQLPPGQRPASELPPGVASRAKRTRFPTWVSGAQHRLPAAPLEAAPCRQCARKPAVTRGAPFGTSLLKRNVGSGARPATPRARRKPCLPERLGRELPLRGVDTRALWGSLGRSPKTAMKSDTCEETTRARGVLDGNRWRTRRSSGRGRVRAHRSLSSSLQLGLQERQGKPPRGGVVPEVEDPHLHPRCARPVVPGGDEERGTRLAVVQRVAVPRNGKRTASEERAT